MARPGGKKCTAPQAAATDSVEPEAAAGASSKPEARDDDGAGNLGAGETRQGAETGLLRREKKSGEFR